MFHDREMEIDQNYDFFQRNLSRFLEEHRGEYALLHRRKVVAWFKQPGDAYRAGLARFPDGLFSIQEADDRPAEIGLTSLALD